MSQTLFNDMIKSSCTSIVAKVSNIGNTIPSDMVTVSIVTSQTYVIPNYDPATGLYKIYINGIFVDSPEIRAAGKHVFTGYYTGGLLGILPGKIPNVRNCPSTWTASNGVIYDGIRDDKTTCYTTTYGRGIGRSAVHVYSKNCCCTAWGCCGNCNSGYTDDGCTCRKDACNSDEQWISSMCYPKCKPGYNNQGCCICEPTQGYYGFQWLWDRQYCDTGSHNIGGLCYAPPGTSTTGWYTKDALFLCNNQELQARGFSNTIYMDKTGANPYIQCPPVIITIQQLSGATIFSQCNPARPLPFDINIVADSASVSGYSLNLRTGNINMDLNRIMIKLKPIWFNVRYNCNLSGPLDLKLPVIINPASAPANSILIINNTSLKLYLPIGSDCFEATQDIDFSQVPYLLMQMTCIISDFLGLIPCGVGAIFGLVLCGLSIYSLATNYDVLAKFVLHFKDFDPLSYHLSKIIITKLKYNINTVEEDACFTGWTQGGLLVGFLSKIAVALNNGDSRAWSNIRVIIADLVTTAKALKDSAGTAAKIVAGVATAGVCAVIDLILAVVGLACAAVDIAAQSRDIAIGNNFTKNQTLFENVILCILPGILNSCGINVNIATLLSTGVPVPTPAPSTTLAPTTPISTLPLVPSIVITNNNNTVSFANNNLATSPNWSLLSGVNEIWTCLSNGKMYGVNSNGAIYYTVNNSNWYPVSSPSGIKIVQLSFDGYKHVVMGIGSDQSIWYANTNIYTTPNWTRIGGSLTNVSYSNGQAYGCNAGGNIYYASSAVAGNWVQIPGGLSRVSFDGYNNIVVGCNSGGNCYYANNARAGNWVNMPGGSITDISYSNGKMACVAAGNIYFATNFATGNWVYVGGSGFKQVSYDDPTIYNKRNYLQYTQTGTDIGSVITGTLYDCQNTCNGNTSCIGFSRGKAVVDNAGGQCYLKQSAPSVTYNDATWNTYVKPSKATSWPL